MLFTTFSSYFPPSCSGVVRFEFSFVPLHRFAWLVAALATASDVAQPLLLDPNVSYYPVSPLLEICAVNPVT